MDKLRLEVLLSARDKITGTLKSMVGGSAAAGRQVKELRDKLKQLENQNSLVTKFRATHGVVKGLTGELSAHQAKVRALAQEHAAAGTVTAAMARKMQAAKNEAGALKSKLNEQRASLQTLRNHMGAAGISTVGLAANERTLRANIEQTNAAMERQKLRLKEMATMQRNASAQAMRGAAVAAGGMGALYGARKAGHVAGGVLAEGKNVETESLRIRALGLGDAEAGKAIEFAKKFASFGTSQLDNMQLMRDAVTVFNDRHHAEDALPFLAKMKAANEVAFGTEHGADNERKFMDMLKVIEMRNGANNREDFERNGNLIQQVITATGGRVGAEDWLNLIKTGGVAAKGIDEKEFFYRLEPLVQEMGGHRVGTGMMSAYQNLYQGRTTNRVANFIKDLGLIADPSKVTHDKVGQTAQLGPGALKGSEIFQRSQFEWMEKILIPTLQAKGYNSEKQILDAMGSIFSNRNAAGLFATMYQQRAMMNKSYALNERADNVDSLYGRAVDTPVGKELELKKRRDDAYVELANAAMPAYVKLLEMLTSAVKWTTKFTQQHPTLTRAVVYTAGGVSILVGALGALAIPVGLMLAKGAALRFVLARLGMQFTLGGAMARAGSVGMGILAKAWAWVARIFTSAAPWLMRTAGFLLRLAGPVGLLATAGIMLYQNWSGVVGGFNILMQQLGDAAMRGVNFIKGLAMAAFDAGASIVMGIANGITSRIQAIRDSISMAAGDAVDWFKEKLGIHSPSRVFMELGGYVSEGAAAGISGNAGMVRNAAVAMAAGSMVAMAPLAAAGPGVGVGGAGAIGGGATYNITINPAPGMDPQAIARAVSAELDRRERDKASGRRSSMADQD